MRITLLDLKDPTHLVVDKTIAGGMGTASRYGGGVFAGLLTRLKASAIKLLPYSVAYVSAILKQQGHQVSYAQQLEGLEAELVVLLTAVPSLHVDQAALKTLRQRGLPTIVTGTLAGAAPEQFSDAHLVLKGEPESFFIQPDWASRLPAQPSGAVLETGFLDLLDRLPFPDWTVFPHLRSQYAILDPLATVLPVVTSRGCPYPCGYYCPYPLGEGKAMRFRSPASVVEELKLLQQRHGVRHVKFRDPIFTVHRNRTLHLLDALIEANLGVRWGCETHLDRLDEPLLEKMAAAGCRLIQTGIETTNPEALQASKRKTATQAHQEQMLAVCRRLGIKTAIYLIMGLPEDTEVGMRSSLEYALTLPATFIQVTACTPYPGTRFFGDVESRLLTRDWRMLDQYTPVLRSDHVTPERLTELMGEGYRRFYLRWSWLRAGLPEALGRG